MSVPHFQLESLAYQTDAVDAVVRVFDGTPKTQVHELAGNRCPLTWEQLQDNIKKLAHRHRISDERLHLTEPQQGQAIDICVEMETGTGKTLVYLRTLYRLHTAYGWNKFIIVVPSVAIRAGVTSVRLALLEDTEAENPQVSTSYIGSTQAPLKPRFAPQDWVQAIGQDSRLSQKAVWRLLQEALQDEHCAKQFVLNPVLFAQEASAKIRRAEREHMLRGLHYTPTGEVLPLHTLKAVVETVKDIAHTPQRGLYEQQAIDSGQEKQFAEAADKDMQLMCVLKLPDGYVINAFADAHQAVFGYLALCGTRLGGRQVHGKDQLCGGRRRAMVCYLHSVAFTKKLLWLVVYSLRKH
jgi:restriction endonuclease